MAEIAAGFAGPAIEVVKWVVEPIKRQFNYLCCFASNIDSLKHEAEELDKATTEVQDQVDIERRKLNDAVPEVITWLDECEKMKEEKETILHEVPNVKEGCLKLGARFSLSRRTKKTVDHMKELLVRKNFNPIARERPLGATQEVPLGKNYEFKSRTKLEKDIMTTLRDVDVNRIGICGMGGLGKTTMAQRIRNRVLEENVFKEAAMTVVSQQVDILKIQVEIGGSLGLTNLQDYSSDVRLQKLHARLTGTERILLILDDVWEGLELESLGIPRGSKACTTLVTSRNRDALSEMDVVNVFEMDFLSEEDAWILFSERVGTCVDDAKLNSIANEVVKECDGLPIALIAVGEALKDKKDERIWKDALFQLRERCLGIDKYDARVYNPIKLSYDFLSSEEAKCLLLLCCLFPEDSQIPLEKLTYICMGLGIFEGIRNLEGARNRISTLTATLTSRSLLFSDSFMNQRCVRMHDVVRDVCRIIAKNGKYIGGNDCAWISSNQLIGERSEFRTELGFPNLRLFLLEKEFNFDIAFLEGIRDLHVLWINNSTLTSLPHATQPLKYLQTLVLVFCQGLKTISVVGELVNLKILKCHGCTSLEELPTEIKRLHRLKLLELVHCCDLQSIGRGIISSLVGLEELKMSNSFNKWEAENRGERKNAGLSELESLTNLTCLEIEIQDPALVAENIHISTKLERFHIYFDRLDFLSEVHNYDKNIHGLRLERETCLGNWIEMQLLRETEYLSLSGNGANKVDFGKSQNMRRLSLSGCDEIHATLFPPSLEHMDLSSLPQLQEISFSSFQNLSYIQISHCPRIRNLAKLSIAAGEDCLSQLEKLHIKHCETIEQVLLGKEEDSNRNNSESTIHSSHVKFPKLKEVTLYDLPNLATFCQGIEGIEFPLLREIYIQECPKWTSMVLSGILERRENKSGGSGSSSNADIDDYSSHLFCQSEKVYVEATLFPPSLEHMDLSSLPQLQEISFSSFQNLSYIQISHCPRIRNLAKLSIAAGEDCLSQLEKLHIKHCETIEQVLLGKEEDSNRNNSESTIHSSHVKFPKLKEVTLYDLPNLATFCQGIEGIEFPLLREIYIQECPKWTSMVLSGILERRENKSGGSGSSSNADIDDYSSHLFCQSEKVYVEATLFPPSLEHMDLSSLPQLQEISFSSFQNLSYIQISHCPRIRNLAQLSIAAGEDCLSQLEKLHIKHCETIEQVLLGKEEDSNRNNSESTIHSSHVKFPKLKEVTLYDLPNLATFCQGIEGIEFPLLREIYIERCPKWTSMVPSGISERRENKSGGSGSSSNADIDDDYSSHLFCQSEKVSLGNLKELTTGWNPFCGHKIHVSYFNGLEILEISEYHGSMSLILSSSIATNLANLESLSIYRCDEMVQVFKDEDKEDKLLGMANINGDERKTVLFPKLEVLRLGFLPKLVSFCELKCDVELPSLRNLEIHSCPKMKNFSSGFLIAPNFSGFLIAPNLEDFSTDFNHHLELVSFNRLKILLTVDGMNTECPIFYHHKLFISLVDGLEKLYLSEHDGMISLFPCSVAGKLVNLRSLEITDCLEMVKVIEEEEEEASGGRRTLLFPKLEDLVLTDLPKLVSFCERKSGVELPSLSKVKIYMCDNMKHFSSGPLTAPNLKFINIDNEDIGGEKDLNGELQHRAKEIEEEEEDYSIEEEEEDYSIEEEEEDNSNGFLQKQAKEKEEEEKQRIAEEKGRRVVKRYKKHKHRVKIAEERN